MTIEQYEALCAENDELREACLRSLEARLDVLRQMTIFLADRDATIRLLKHENERLEQENQFLRMGGRP